MISVGFPLSFFGNPSTVIGYYQAPPPPFCFGKKLENTVIGCYYQAPPPPFCFGKKLENTVIGYYQVLQFLGKRLQKKLDTFITEF
jgi:hypothetical protein